MNMKVKKGDTGESKMLYNRIKVALILVIILVILTLYSSVLIFSIFLGVCLLTAAWEGICLLVNNKYKRYVIMSLIVSIFILLYFFPNYIGLQANIIVSILCWFQILTIMYIFPKKIKIVNEEKLLLFIVLVLIVLCFKSLLEIRAVYGIYYFYMSLLTVSFIDSISYLVGSNIGTIKIFKRISPNKTIEGLLAGLLLPVCLYYFYCNYVNVKFSESIIIFSIIIIMSIIGDLFISMIKRIKKVKDTGTILSSHGGILDRMDSIIASSPYFLVLIECFK